MSLCIQFLIHENYIYEENNGIQPIYARYGPPKKTTPLLLNLKCVDKEDNVASRASSVIKYRSKLILMGKSKRH